MDQELVATRSGDVHRASEQIVTWLLEDPYNDTLETRLMPAIKTNRGLLSTDITKLIAPIDLWRDIFLSEKDHMDEYVP
jgi:hypothetical protein